MALHWFRYYLGWKANDSSWALASAGVYYHRIFNIIIVKAIRLHVPVREYIKLPIKQLLFLYI